MSKHLRKQIFSNMNMKDTHELVRIWRKNDRYEWSDLAFDVIKEILQTRLGVLPSQGVPRYDPHEPEVSQEIMDEEEQMGMQSLGSMDESGDELSTEREYRSGPSANWIWTLIALAVTQVLILIGQESSIQAVLWYYVGCILLFALILVVWRARGKTGVVISNEGVYLSTEVPFHKLSFDNHTFVPFSDITGVSTRGDDVNTIFCIHVRDKTYQIHSMFLRSSDDFEEIVKIIRARVSSRLKASQQ